MVAETKPHGALSPRFPCSGLNGTPRNWLSIAQLLGLYQSPNWAAQVIAGGILLEACTHTYMHTHAHIHTHSQGHTHMHIHMWQKDIAREVTKVRVNDTAVQSRHTDFSLVIQPKILFFRNHCQTSGGSAWLVQQEADWPNVFWEPLLNCVLCWALSQTL